MTRKGQIRHSWNVALDEINNYKINNKKYHQQGPEHWGQAGDQQDENVSGLLASEIKFE